MTDLVLILTTMPDDEHADALARAIVEERLAACVNVHPAMSSTYRWKGLVEHETERQLVIKTTRARIPEIEARFRTLHPYDLPEFLVVAVDRGSAAYLEWVLSETGDRGTA